MNDWDDYRLILALSRADSLRTAADELGVNHATVSRRLANLQRKAGIKLFEKSANGYEITKLGAPLLAAAQQMEHQVFSSSRLLRAADSSDPAGSVSISLAAPIAQYLVLDRLSEFQTAYPNIELILHTSEQVVDLDRSEADVVLRSANLPPEHLVGRRFFSYGVRYYAAIKYLDKTPESQRTWIAAENDNTTADWILNSPFPEQPIGFRTQGYHARHLALLAGLGMARGACFMADQEPSLRRLDNASVTSSLDLWVLTHPDLRNSPRVQAVMHFLYDILQDKRALITGIL